MAKSYDAIHIYGDEATTLWIRRKGTGNGEMPTGLAKPESATGFRDGGWLGEDGIDLEVSADVSKFNAYQGGTIVKTRVTKTERTFKLQFLQEDDLTTEVFYDHSGVTEENGVARYDIPKAIGYSEWEFLIDFVDGGKTKRLVTTASAGERGTVPHKSDDMTVYEVTFDMIGDAYVLTDDETMLAAAGAAAGADSAGSEG